VARLRLLHGVHRQEPDRVHRLRHQLGRRRRGRGAERGGRSAAAGPGPDCSGEWEAGAGGRAEKAHDDAAAGAGRRRGGGGGGGWCCHGCGRVLLGRATRSR
jgi:hypothetical protein